MKKSISIFGTLLLVWQITLADEGMWLPFRLKEQTIQKMQELGLNLSANQIYTADSASFNQAVVGLGINGRPFRHFCTGGLISDEGLFLTNHHCGYGYIQQYSTIDNDYLTNGFWAYDKSQELQATNLTVSILVRMEDVTAKAFENITNDMPTKTRDSILRINIHRIEKEAVQGTHLKAKVNEFYGGNEYYLSVYEIFEDVRMVGAPPSAIGKFGGDTDNWVWPRHTGDFMLFRIYAGPDNKPAPYSPNNKPYKPTRYFKINPQGVSENTFTFVMGYPGTTEQYLPSYAIKFIKNTQNPLSIHLREIRIETMKKHMELDPKVRIQYSSKVASAANAWKKWIGEIQGLERFNVVGQKQELENKFRNYYSQNPDYLSILNQYNEIYQKLTTIMPFALYFTEGVLRIEILSYAGSFNEITQADSATISSLIKQTRTFFKNYHIPLDREIFVKILAEFNQNIPENLKPTFLVILNKKFKNNSEKIADWVFSRTILTDSTKVLALISNPKEHKKLEKDPAFQLWKAFSTTYDNQIRPQLVETRQNLPELNRQFIKALREMQPESNFYPDANSTFRISYGQAKGYSPRDAVQYHYQTTLQGIIEKDNPTIYDYNVPEKLRELYRKGDYGSYTNSQGQLPVCFAATNHTTGGNSGSPILDASGRLVGINFDRAWDGVMSDMYYNPLICRNIGLDIRYILFIIDKFAGAQNIINEIYSSNN